MVFLSNVKRTVFFFLSIIVFVRCYGQVTTDISGVVNSYHKVIDVVPSKACVLVDDVGTLAHGDMVLLIQMKGASIITTNTSTFGDTTGLNDVGNYEVATVCAVIDDSVFFFHNIINNYNFLSGKVQLVKIAEYFSARVVDTIKAVSWDSLTGKGGVIAIRVDEDLTLQKPIYADSSGYKGGQFILQDGTCPFAGSAWIYNPTVLTGGGQGAYKGESVTDLLTSISGGKGAPANGGGGGNNHNNSGGGGANLTAGGAGGGNSSTGPFGCNVSNNWGRAGKPLSSWSGKKIFPGGGGGAGHSNGGVFSKGGGNGGGLVFIWATTLNGGGQTISANGDAGGPSVSDGAGGGGAGGTIIMNVTNYSGSLTISANGGKGGNSDDGGNPGRCFGGGGGGSGGAIYFTGAVPGVTITATAGAAGAETGQSGCAGSVPGLAGSTGSIFSSYSFTRSTDPAGYCILLLPSRLMVFEVSVVSKKVWLQWRILNPELARYFIVERKGYNNQWTGLSSTPSVNAQEKYFSFDNTPLPGTSFYRLKIVEQNGSVYYSETRLIEFDPSAHAFTFYPNPARQSITINGDFNNPVMMRVLDLSGRLILQKLLTNDRTEIILPDLSAGIYFIRIGQSVRKLVIR
jgi:hypothetical protein